MLLSLVRSARSCWGHQTQTNDSCTGMVRSALRFMSFCRLFLLICLGSSSKTQPSLSFATAFVLPTPDKPLSANVSKDRRGRGIARGDGHRKSPGCSILTAPHSPSIATGRCLFPDDWMDERIEKADSLEIRLDATLVLCYVLSRFLAVDLSTPPKAVPGFQVEDVILLLNTFSSASLLVGLWVIIGLGTRLFERPLLLSRVVYTALFAGPLWAVIESTLRWQPFDHPSSTEDGLFATLGLCGTILIGRVVSTFLR